MGITPLDRLLMWFNRPRKCQECGAVVQRNEPCTDWCEAEIADRMAY